MKKLSTLAFIIIISCLIVRGQDTIFLQGRYYGRNLYVINPNDSLDSTFCVKKVQVNGKDTKDELHSNSFEIDFPQLNIAVGADVKVMILHNTACKPKVINPEVLQAPSTFGFLNIKVDKTAKLTWVVKGELYSAFTVEQFRWKKWLTLGEVDITDTVKKNTYAFEIKPHFGVNQFRVSHTDERGRVVYSKIAKYRNATVKEITLASTKVTDVITFTGETAYEIFDEKGTFMMDGLGTEINVTDLPKGKYWVNYDNKTEMVTKK